LKLICTQALFLSLLPNANYKSALGNGFLTCKLSWDLQTGTARKVSEVIGKIII